MDLKAKQEYFKGIYEVMVNKIFRFVLLRVGGREEALDITEEVFYKFWQAVYNGEQIDLPNPFLFKIARHKVIDWYRKSKSDSLERLMENKETDYSEKFQIMDEGAFEKLEISAEARYIVSSLQKLGAEYQEVVQMRFVDGLSTQDIAETLNITPNAVSLRLNRGLQKLRDELHIKIENKNE